MVREGLRPKLRAAIERASRGRARAMVTDAYLIKDHDPSPVCIAVEPVKMHDEELLLVSFLDGSVAGPQTNRLPAPLAGGPQAAVLERRLADVTKELEIAIQISTAQRRTRAYQRTGDVSERGGAIHQ